MLRPFDLGMKTMVKALCRATAEVPLISFDISQKLTNILPEGVGLGADGVD
jgi:hypothetical protein